MDDFCVYCRTERPANTLHSCPGSRQAEELKAALFKLGTLEETHLMQLAAISTASMCNTPESDEKQRIGRDNPYWTVAYEDTRTAIAREMALMLRLGTALDLLREVWDVFGPQGPQQMPADSIWARVGMTLQNAAVERDAPIEGRRVIIPCQVCGTTDPMTHVAPCGARELV